MGQNRLTLLFKYQIGLNIEFESYLPFGVDYEECQVIEVGQ